MTVGRTQPSEYRAMWLFAMFDLPVKTKKDRKRYARFRKLLIREGFTMLQLSVYARYCPSEEASQAHRNRILAEVPAAGQVRLLAVTDRQFGKMVIYESKKPREPEKAPDQLVLF